MKIEPFYNDILSQDKYMQRADGFLSAAAGGFRSLFRARTQEKEPSEIGRLIWQLRGAERF
ncbi:MAG: hypothetical protein JSS81_15540 [Acidobacteria bacterium]|nr:hypothetical protein [Acidobacteriota bacterium]